jgi:hypothetical protein
MAAAPIDPAAEANELADAFNEFSQAVDEFRLADHDPPLTQDELARLKDEAQALENRSHHFTAEAIGATLQSIQPNLAGIKSITAQATAQLGTLNTADRVITIATSALGLATAIATGNVMAIVTAASDLAAKVV